MPLTSFKLLSNFFSHRAYEELELRAWRGKLHSGLFRVFRISSHCFVRTEWGNLNDKIFTLIFQAQKFSLVADLGANLANLFSESLVLTTVFWKCLLGMTQSGRGQLAQSLVTFWIAISSYSPFSNFFLRAAAFLSSSVAILLLTLGRAQ